MNNDIRQLACNEGFASLRAQSATLCAIRHRAAGLTGVTLITIAIFATTHTGEALNQALTLATNAAATLCVFALVATLWPTPAWADSIDPDTLADSYGGLDAATAYSELAGHLRAAIDDNEISLRRVTMSYRAVIAFSTLALICGLLAVNLAAVA